MKQKKKQVGFTIVELLIVIVVIAILAAITIVAYNGIVNRSENQKIQATTLKYYKALSNFKTDNGSYPTNAQSGNAYVCLTDYSSLADTTCANFTGGIVAQSAFNNILAQYMNGSTTLDTHSDKFIFTNNNNNWWRGVRYQTSSGGQLSFVQYDTSSCPLIAGSTPVLASATNNHKICTITLP